MDDYSLVLRPITNKDLTILETIAKTVGPGLTSLPNNKPYLEQKLERATKSFAEDLANDERLYLFVLEDIETNQPAGVCGIEANVGVDFPFYNFKISSIKQFSKTLNKSLEHKVLFMVNNFTESSELVSLFLYPKYRGGRRAELLSRSRFLFMAEFSNLFYDIVISEIRGVSDSEGKSPFWESVCKPFFDLEFTDADSLTNTAGKQFISDLMPTYPIYLDLLSKDLEEVIGQPNKDSLKALSLLKKEGFMYRNYVDIFDAGPLIESRVKDVKTVANSNRVKVKILDKINVKDEKCINVIISNTCMNFRLCLANISIVSDELIEIDSITAEKLNISESDYVRYCEF